MQLVKSTEWDLTALADDERRARLLDPPSPAELIDAVIQDAHYSVSQGEVKLSWEPAIGPESPRGLVRLWTQIPVTQATFDQLFNGRSGYRAQYYLSPEEGLAFNRAIIDGLTPAVKQAYAANPLPIPFGVIEQSLREAHAKIWIFNDKDAFNTAPAYMLNPPRWVENKAYLGRRVPLPSHLSIDLKGSFIDPTTGGSWVHEYKVGRANDLHLKGFA